MDDPERLHPIYERQFTALSPHRRRLYGRLPLRRCRHLVEPGCGTGLILAELAALVRGRLTGIDRDATALTEAAFRLQPVSDIDRSRISFLCRDVEGSALPAADLYVTAFLLCFLRDPAIFLRQVYRALTPGGHLAVLAEYDYAGICQDPADSPWKVRIVDSLQREGVAIDSGRRVDTWSRQAGFIRLDGGRITGPLQPADPLFTAYQLGSTPDPSVVTDTPATDIHPLPRVNIPVYWGVYLRP